MLSTIILIVSVFFCGEFVSSTDYCNKFHCRVWTGKEYIFKTHVGCNNHNKFSGACPTDATQIQIEDTPLQDMIVDLHNHYRGILARGELGFKQAARMPRMQWHSELAYLAGLNAKTCIFNHDQCRNTDEFEWSGQNLAAHHGNTGSNASTIIDGSHRMWFEEYMNTTQSHLDSFYSPPKPILIGHFTAMVQDKAKYVGCALVEYTTEGLRYSQFTCNYSYTNVFGAAVYDSSGPVCSKCQTECMNGLCSDDEVVKASPYN